MRVLALILTFLVFALPATAQQSTADDKSFLETWLQDNLSNVGRQVEISGFEGALSSQAQLQALTISDEDGVWLTMTGVQLDWTRSALLSGRLDIQNLSADQIEIARAPSADSSLSVGDAHAGSFALPELPVSVDIGRLAVTRVVLGPELTGETLAFELAGNLQLSGGEGSAHLRIERVGRDDRLELNGAYSNTSRTLHLDLGFDEAQGGFVSHLLSIPGAPALHLKVNGNAPISDFSAQLALSAAGQPLLQGQATISSDELQPDAYAFSADLGGDMRPLFPADLHPFFGKRTGLTASGHVWSDGRVGVDALNMTSGAMNITGQLAVAADGLPERFSLNGKIGDGSALRLPVPGTRTTVERITATAKYDAALGEQWEFLTIVSGLTRDGNTIQNTSLAGTGRISRQPETAVDGNISYSVIGLSLANPALRNAIGSSPVGTMRFAWSPGAPLDLDRITLSSAGLTLRASGEASNLLQGLELRGEAEGVTEDIGRFSALAGRDLSGTISARLSGTATVMTGAFDLEATARADDLSLGLTWLDPALQGTSNLIISAARDTAGTRLKRLDISSEEISAKARGSLSSMSGTLLVEGRVSDISIIDARIAGQTDAKATVAWNSGGEVTLSDLSAQIEDTWITAQGALDPGDPILPAKGSITLKSDDLSRFSALIGQPVSGQIDLSAEGSGQLRGRDFNLAFNVAGRNFRAGIAELDRLLEGQMSATGAVASSSAGLDLNYFKLSSANLNANASGSGPNAPINVSARLVNLGTIATGLDGPASVAGTVKVQDQAGKRLQVTLDASGPGNIKAQVNGAINDYGKTLAIDIDGVAPLAIANRFIAPQSVTGLAQLDLRLEGPAQLSSLAGTVTVTDARASLPTIDYALSDLAGTASLAAGRATIQMDGTTGRGGQFVLEGPVELAAPYTAQLALGLTGLGLTDYEIYQTTVNGDLAISGPLQGGARIGGILNLGKTELRIPSGSGVTVGTLPDIKHLYEPADVALTRKRAGLTGKQAESTVSFPIDLTINAPNKIFVRGRGLDAELGGQLRLTGTTADVRPSGVFELIRGRIDILGKRLTLTEGQIDLRGTFDPYLRFVAETSAEEYLINIILEGLASAPEVVFSASPDLPQEEIVARLLFGRGLTAISPFQAAQLVSAVATLTGRYSGGLAGKLRSSLGLSDLDISTTQTGATQLRAGGYVSDNIYSEVTADSEGRQQINLNLDLSSSVTVKGRASTDGNTGIGIFFEKDY